MKKVIFNGVTYYKTKSGYYQYAYTAKRQREGVERRLHRAVWVFYNGKIPKGLHIHHIDGNKDNNDISNLKLMTQQEHMQYHNTSERLSKWWKSEKGIKANKKGIKNAKKWHASEDGKKWHSEHQKQYINKLLIKETCSECGNIFNTFNDKRHQTVCKKCRDKLLKRYLRKYHPEKIHRYHSTCILTNKNNLT